MKVVCPACATDIDLTGKRPPPRRCPVCDAVLPGTLGPAPGRSPANDRLDPRVEERWRDGQVRFVLRPQRWAAIPLVFFTLVWNVFLVGWFRVAIEHPGPVGIALWLPLLHVAVGGVVAYEALQAMFGRVELTMDRGVLGARRRPFPGPGSLGMATAELTTFDVRTTAPSILAFRPEIEGGARHEVVAVDREGGHRRLPISFPDEGRARQMAARLDEALRTLRAPQGYRS